MKFKITITKEVIDKSLMCGTEEFRSKRKPAHSHCAFAVAYNELVPMYACLSGFIFFDKIGDTIAIIDPSRQQVEFISRFDGMASRNVNDRYTLVGQTFDVEIPDEVIEYWHGDAVTAAQKLIDNPIMQTV